MPLPLRSSPATRLPALSLPIQRRPIFVALSPAAHAIYAVACGPTSSSERVVPTCRSQPLAGHVPCPSAAVQAQPTEFCFPAAAIRAVASIPSRFKGGQVRQACHQFTATAMEGFPVHGALRASLPDWVSCLKGPRVEHRVPAGVTGNMPLPSAQHRLVLPYINQRQGTPSHGTRGNTLPCAFSAAIPHHNHTPGLPSWQIANHFRFQGERYA